MAYVDSIFCDLILIPSRRLHFKHSCTKDRCTIIDASIWLSVIKQMNLFILVLYWNQVPDLRQYYYYFSCHIRISMFNDLQTNHNKKEKSYQKTREQNDISTMDIRV